MGGIDQAIADEMLSHSIDLFRLDAGTRERVLAILNRLQRELVSKLANEDLTAISNARTQALLKEIAAVIDDYFARAQGELALTLQGAAPITADHTAQALTTVFQAKIGVGLPTETYLARLASNVLTQGAVTADWWARLAADTAFKVANAVRQGLMQGETNQQIIARITGKVGVPGVMDISRRNAAAVVQTSALTVANAARLKTLEANAGIAPRLKWFSALDGHVCPRCIALSGKIWTNSKDGTHEPVGHSVPFQNPPIHWNDRCLLLPITKSFSELGIDLPEPAPSTRASSEGQISASTTFEQWLGRRSVEQQDEQLGPGKADLWRRKVITLSQLIDGRGRELTLAQLKAKYL